MLGNFEYCNPKKLYFGEDSLNYLNTELPKYGDNVVLIYGGGSIKKNGIYDDVCRLLKDNGKNVAEISGVMPNPTLEKLYEGVEIAGNHHADLLLAVGGGSVCDFAKAVSVSVTDWMVHMIGQSVGAYTNATHGMTLAAVSLPYYRHIMPYGIEKFKRFAVNVWDVDPEGKSDEQTAEEGLKAMESWMRELGLVMNISELGASEEMIDGIADGTLIMQGGYKILDRDEVKQILIESM